MAALVGAAQLRCGAFGEGEVVVTVPTAHPLRLPGLVQPSLCTASRRRTTRSGGVRWTAPAVCPSW
ncbi:hypothetical protein GCM10012286_45880 [Streptomyces lasiicapitis]|uniref:Uncharacterized protein n=1 Tax=Streptomyces lasiicapitis TaxID=1923961 RepID=A0ABQ2MAF4_9ACTN|nr:hypothetical protein GCM10012286_45880 [Streptomyces lasiicapitis]